MPQGQVDRLMELWAAFAQANGLEPQPPFASNQDLLDTIDSTPNGNVRWESFSVKYCGPVPENDPPSWMFQEYEVWYRNAKDMIATMLRNKDFDGEYDYVPYREFDENGKRCYKDLMSGDWAWLKAVRFIFSFAFNILNRPRTLSRLTKRLNVRAALSFPLA